MIYRIFLAVAAAMAINGAPLAAAPLGGAKPVIVLRSQPATAYARIYVIYSGALEHMIATEEAVAKVFEGTPVAVLRASEDFSSLSQLQDPEVKKRIAARSAGGALVLFFLEPVSVTGSEVRFRMSIRDPDAGEVAAGEVTIDASKQLTLFDSAAQSQRIAVRDAAKRFLADKRVRALFR